MYSITPYYNPFKYKIALIKYIVKTRYLSINYHCKQILLKNINKYKIRLTDVYIFTEK